MISISLNTPHPRPPLLGREFVPGTLIYSKIKKLEYLNSLFVQEQLADVKQQVAEKNQRLAQLNAETAIARKLVAELRGETVT